MAFGIPQRAKRDANEPSVVDIFEAHGISVERADKPLDLVLGYAGRTYLVEVKNGPKAPTTTFQDAFFVRWRGHAVIVCGDDEATDLARAIRAGDV